MLLLASSRDFSRSVQCRTYKRLNMEQIKVGDIVRVSEDIPRFYRRYNSMRIFEVTHNVADIQDGLALLDSIPVKYVTMLPTKYLVKVNAEPKSKYKVGDRVKFKSLDELRKVIEQSFHWRLSEFANKEAAITAVEDNGLYRVDIDPSVGGINDAMIECKVEPKEKPNADTITAPVEADLTDGFWRVYEADLAKEIAVKLAGNVNFNDAKEKAAYAVEYAREIIENLKK